jgi:hypothetical protein
MMRALMLLLLCGTAHADYVLFDVYTKHPDSQPWMQNKTPGIQYISNDGWTIGGFCNSYSSSQLKPERDELGRSTGRKNCAQTWDIGRTWDSGGKFAAGAMVAGAWGYGRGVRIGNTHMMPIVMPYLRIGPVQVGALAPATWHLALRVNLDAP